MLAHIYYLFIYVLTDTKNSNFCVMKVKDFISWIRPITALDPESEVIICNFKVPCNLDIEKIIISDEVTHISVVPNISKSDE